MDQVKVYLAVLKKHHFWPLVVLILAIGVYGWKAGAAHYDALYATNSSTLNGMFSKVDAVANIPQHPNEFFIDEVKQLNSQQTKDVMAAWQKLYDNQMQILTWPKEFEEIGKLKPTAPIPASLRQIVLNYFHHQFPHLFGIISLREEVKPDPNAANAATATPDPAVAGGDGDAVPPDAAPAAAQPAGMGMKRDTKAEIKGIVVWPNDQREKIVNSYRWSRAPSSKQIRYAQEDYWVYQALLKIISETNRGVTVHRNAAIKKIDALDIAQAVPPPNDFLFPVPDGTVAPVDESSKPKPGGSKAMGAAMSDEELDNGRYVGSDGKPLASPGSDNKEYKLMPIRMRFVMDQRKLPELLVACANSPLPVDVQRVQFRPSESSSGSARGGMGRGSSIGKASQPTNVPRGPATSDQLVELSPDDQVIEVRGVIYIFNPPDLGELAEQPAEGTEESAADATTEEPATEEPAAEEPAPPAESAPAAETPMGEEAPMGEEGATGTEPGAEPAAPMEPAAAPAEEAPDAAPAEAPAN